MESRPPSFSRLFRLIPLWLGLPLAACSQEPAGDSQGGVVGSLLEMPGGGFYVVDPHQGGSATRLKLAETLWGRVVDVHDVDAQGNVSLDPVLRDFVIDENVQTNATDFRLETSPITEKTRLVILRERDAPDTGHGTFASLLAQSSTNLAPVLPRGGDPMSLLPFSYVPRNACLVLRFDDLLDDDQAAFLALTEAVKLQSGYPPSVPAGPRILFDRNHGGVVGGRFHSTRILVDLTISEVEAADMLVPQPIQSLGLPASNPDSPSPNAVLRLPTRLNFGAGQFSLLRNLAGASLSIVGNGPVDSSSPTEDVVRFMRSGNQQDQNNGFLLDFNPPRVIGAWPMSLTAADVDPSGQAGFDFLIDVQFGAVCQADPRTNDIFEVGNLLLEVTSPAAFPGVQGTVNGVRVRNLSARPLFQPSSLLGAGLYRTPQRIGSLVPDGCWLRFTPDPNHLPNDEVSPLAQVHLRFSKPMDPDSFDLDSFQIIRGPLGTSPDARSIVIGAIVAGLDQRDFTFSPLLPLTHQGISDPYLVRLRSDPNGKPNKGVTDLAGNPLSIPFPTIEFTIDPRAPFEKNGGIVLGFGSVDELDPHPARDWRGNVFLDSRRDALEPRPVDYFSWPVDRTNPVPSIMIPFPPGVQTPLSPLGSKLQAVWRYADLGWSVSDITKYDVDVIGLSWAPVGGQVVSDFFEEFEIRLAHSYRLPDETRRNLGGARYPLSGLGGAGMLFSDNILVDPASPQIVVHSRSLGYRVDPSDLFMAGSGTDMLPWPMNRNPSSLTTFTWRDTSVRVLGGPNGGGVPMNIEVGAPLFLEVGVGSFAAPWQVPSVGLPLLMEFRCYPSQSGIGLNALDINLAINTSAQPNFRAYSTGGINNSGAPVLKDPDLETFPTGGFNPRSRPPGNPTRLAADNALYIGQLDAVLRVSRGHSMWIDSFLSNPRYLPPLLEPQLHELPAGTEVVLDFRGADAFATNPPGAPFNADALDAYGEVRNGTVFFHAGDSDWHSQISEIDGARYFQMRLSFIGNIQTRLAAHLASLAIAFDER